VPSGNCRLTDAVVTPKGKPYDARLFALVIGTRLDSFSGSESDPSPFTMTDGYPLVEYNNPGKLSGLALSKPEIGGRQLWRESRFHGLETFRSEDLVATRTEPRMMPPRMFRRTEVWVDSPHVACRVTVRSTFAAGLNNDRIRPRDEAHAEAVGRVTPKKILNRGDFDGDRSWYQFR